MNVRFGVMVVAILLAGLAGCTIQLLGRYGPEGRTEETVLEPDYGMAEGQKDDGGEHSGGGDAYSVVLEPDR